MDDILNETNPLSAMADYKFGRQSMRAETLHNRMKSSAPKSFGAGFRIS